MLGNEKIIINSRIEEVSNFKAQNIPLNIIYEDDDIIIINKPRNLVVHPGAGHHNGTILNALLYYYPPIIRVPRAGIVHRLDKDTTGLMVVAKTIRAQIKLVSLLQLRAITREYEAIVIGDMNNNGTVSQPISRDRVNRTRMSVNITGKPAVTHYSIIERFGLYTRLKVQLETGLTHQIRVHMAWINHPLLGDQVYGGYNKLPQKISKKFIIMLHDFNRQALHATMLRFYHPISGYKMEWHAPLPQDMLKIIDTMRLYLKQNQINIIN